MIDDTRLTVGLERPAGIEYFYSSRRLRLLTPFFSLTLGVIAWEMAGRWAGFRFLPPFSRVVRATIELIATGQIAAPLLASLLSLVAGYGVAVTFGILVGVLMGRNRTIEFVLSPYMNAFLAAPKIALVPVLYAVFGLSRLIQVAVIFLSAFFVIVLNTMRGIQTVDPAFVEMAHAFGASPRQLFLKVLLPGALPLTMAGLRLAIGHAVRGMVTAEMLVALFGLGALLRTYGGRFDAERLFAVLLVVIGVALFCSYGVKAVERRMTRWDEADS
jgi:NitT/TauT family transport system permease protein